MRNCCLSVFYTNYRHSFNRINLLREMASVENVGILTLTETWLDVPGKVFNPEVEIDDFTLYYKDREHRQRDGVAL